MKHRTSRRKALQLSAMAARFSFGSQEIATNRQSNEYENMNQITTKVRLSQAAPTAPVQAIGDLRQIASNSLNNKVEFRSLNKKSHLYGLGMPQGLNSEVLILDGQAYLGQFKSLAYEVQQPDNFKISFMVYAYVPSWTKIKLPETVQTFADLEQYLPEAASDRKIDPAQPFPFRLEGEISALNWFVVNGMGNNGVPNYLDSFFRTRYLGGLSDRTIEALGFYSNSHRGVLTNPKSNMHIHFKTTDDKLFVGHINDNIVINSGSYLFLPDEIAN